MTQVNNVLEEIPFLADLDIDGRNYVVDVLEHKVFEAGEVLCRAGDPGDKMYFILDGKVKVLFSPEGSNNETVIAELGAGNYVGEMSLLTGEPRSASVISVIRSEVGVFHKKDFDTALERFPGLSISMGKVMNRRLRATLQKVMSAASDNGPAAKKNSNIAVGASETRAKRFKSRTSLGAESEQGDFSAKVIDLIAREDLDDHIQRNKDEFESLIQAVKNLAETAFAQHEPTALYQVHKALYALYEDQVKPIGDNTYNQDNPFLLNIRNVLESRWEQYELARVNIDPGGVPEDPEAFGEYFTQLCVSGSMAEHPLFDFLEHRATRTDLIKFFLSDAAVIVRFCDLVVLSMVGADDEIRGELADNLWDEMGHGRFQERHVHLFENLLEYAGIDLPDGPLSVDQFIGNLEWQGLAGYNFYLFLCLHRRNQLRSLGALGAAESMDPAQYTRVLAGCRRVGFDEISYYAGHESMDVGHGDHWLRNVLLPLVRKYPDKRQEIVIGARMRINVTIDYYDGLAARFTGT